MTLTQAFLTLDDLNLLSHVAPDVFDNPIHAEGARAFLSAPNHFIAVGQDSEKIRAFSL